jgi:hypothetical protein
MEGCKSGKGLSISALEPETEASGPQHIDKYLELRERKKRSYRKWKMRE